MALAGPRLDRPSAIGDEGRPRGTSLALATLATIAALLLAGYALGDPGLVLSIGLLAGMAVAGVALLERERFTELLVGHVLLLAAGGVLAALVLAAPLESGLAGVTVAGMAVCLLGLTATWADTTDIGSARRAALGSILGLGVLVSSVTVLSVLAIVGFLAVLVLWILLVETVAGTAGGSVVLFLAVGSGSLVLAGLSLLVMPVELLVARSRRAKLRARFDGIPALLVLTGSAGYVLVGILTAAWIAGAFADLRAIGGVEPAFHALGSPWVLTAVAVPGTALVVAAIVSRALRLFTRRVSTSSARVIAALVSSTVLALPVSLVVLGVYLFLGGVAAFLVFMAVVLSVFLVALVTTVLVAAGEFGLLPDRAGGLAVAALGLLLVALPLSALDPWMSLPAIVAAVFLWDTGSFGLGLTVELGHRPDTRALELLHGAVALSAAIAILLVVGGFEFLRSTVVGELGGTVSLSLLVLAALVLVVALRS